MQKKLSLQRQQKIERAAKARQDVIVVFEDIHDPHNAAAVLRSCDAFGVQQAWFIFEKQKKWNPKKVGKASSSSANKWLDFKIYTSTKKCLSDLHRKGYTIVATALDAKAKSLFKANFRRKKIALLVGNEHSGLSPAAISGADEVVYLPMRGFVQSLNLSVTTGIFLFEITRQREMQQKKYMLSPKDRRKLIRDWQKQ